MKTVGILFVLLVSLNSFAKKFDFAFRGDVQAWDTDVEDDSCQDFSGEWTGVCHVGSNSENTTFKISQLGCDAWISNSNPTWLYLNGSKETFDTDRVPYKPYTGLEKFYSEFNGAKVIVKFEHSPYSISTQPDFTSLNSFEITGSVLKIQSSNSRGEVRNCELSK